MKKMEDFIDEIKTRYGITKQVELAEKLGLTQATISAHYNRRRRAKHYSEETAYRIAEALGLDPLYVLSCLAAERSKDSALRKQWERIPNLLRSTAVAALMALTLPPSDSQANIRTILHNATEYTLYEILKLLRRLQKFIGLLCFTPITKTTRGMA